MEKKHKWPNAHSHIPHEKTHKLKKKQKRRHPEVEEREIPKRRIDEKEMMKTLSKKHQIP